MTDDVLAEQLAYYRSRAGEYDATAYGEGASARVARLVEQLRPRGAILEIACGTGFWTAALAAHASTLTALDAAPETIEIARARVPLPGVTFAVADIFAWTTAQRFDVVFFSAWLSHVPASRFAEFWARLRPLVADGGRVLFVDEHVDQQDKESYLQAGGEIARRALLDGSTFRIVKNFVDPDELCARLAGLGWQCRIVRDGTDWVCGEARPER